MSRCFSSNHTFGFQVTQSMTPLAKVVVYHLRKDGEVVADALNFFVEGILQNFVNLIRHQIYSPNYFFTQLLTKWYHSWFWIQVEVQVPNVVGPGRNVGITVKTKPNSYVSILGVDQRAATDNILTKVIKNSLLIVMKNDLLPSSMHHRKMLLWSTLIMYRNRSLRFQVKRFGGTWLPRHHKFLM